MADRPAEHFIAPTQLCIGLHVHLDLSWMQHPFTFSSFKIKSLDQIATIQSLGLERIRYSPAKSDSEPLPLPADPAPQAAAPHPEQDNEAVRAKQERVQRLSTQQAKVVGCERDFMSATKAMKTIALNLFAKPDAAHVEADALVKELVASMLAEADVAIMLMSDKVGGEDVYYHALNVTLLSLMLAKELAVPPEQAHLMGMGALFHDVGKEDVAEHIVRKASPLTKAERAALHEHCALGVAIARKLGLSPEGLAVVEQHHELVDGSGYPSGLKGDQLPLLSKIVAVVNAYDNLCNPPNPAHALTPHEALSLMYAQQRSWFDTAALSTFIRCMGVYPPGTVVVLSNDTVGIVVAVNSSRPLKPTVLIYDPDVPKNEAIVVDLEQEPDVSISRTLKPQQLPRPIFDYLAPRKRMSYFFDASTGVNKA
jgi:putative nucleotidyltransferase with HDIG domain